MKNDGLALVSNIEPGGEILSVQNISLSFGGVKALTEISFNLIKGEVRACLLYTSPSPRDQRGSRMPSSA